MIACLAAAAIDFDFVLVIMTRMDLEGACGIFLLFLLFLPAMAVREVIDNSG